jgi:hypothetical protein
MPAPSSTISWSSWKCRRREPMRRSRRFGPRRVISRMHFKQRQPLHSGRRTSLLGTRDTIADPRSPPLLLRNFWHSSAARDDAGCKWPGATGPLIMSHRLPVNGGPPNERRGSWTFFLGPRGASQGVTLTGRRAILGSALHQLYWLPRASERTARGRALPASREEDRGAHTAGGTRGVVARGRQEGCVLDLPLIISEVRVDQMVERRGAGGHHDQTAEPEVDRGT